MATSPFSRKAPSLPPDLAAAENNWLEPRRNPFARSKYRPKGDRHSISLDYAIANENGQSAVSTMAAAAILEDPFDADWAALAMRNNYQSTAAQQNTFQQEKAWI